MHFVGGFENPERCCAWRKMRHLGGRALFSHMCGADAELTLRALSDYLCQGQGRCLASSRQSCIIASYPGDPVQ